MNAPPRLLYIGNVPIEAGLGGSALLYRLLCEYPADRLMIFQVGEGYGYGFERLPDLPYRIIKRTRFLPSRWQGLQAVASIVRSEITTRSIPALLDSYQPDAILTVAHGSEWITAWKVARRMAIPLHLILHDDWEPSFAVPRILRNWVRKRFADAYRDAASRLCVSPYMVAYYEKQYGVSGSVLYPSRAKDVVAFKDPPVTRKSAFTVAYAGSVHGAFSPVLREMALSLSAIGGRLVIFSTVSKDDARTMNLELENIDLKGVLPPKALIQQLREKADALLLVMTESGLNARIYFPSKLVDYTATGLPIIISTPEDSVPAYWARENPAAAVLITSKDKQKLRDAVVELARDPERRRSLGAEALRVGDEQFSYIRARNALLAAVTRAESSAEG